MSANRFRPCCIAVVIQWQSGGVPAGLIMVDVMAARATHVAMSVKGRDWKPAFAGKRSFMWGQRMWDVLGQWLSELRWPPATAPQAKEGITWLELAIDYEVFTGHNIPPSRASMERAGLDMGKMGSIEAVEHNERFVVQGADGNCDAATLQKRARWGDAGQGQQSGPKRGAASAAAAGAAKRPKCPLGECAWTLSFAVGRVGTLLGEDAIFPRGTMRESGIKTLKGLDGKRDGWAGISRRPILAGGKDTERMLRSFAEQHVETAWQKRERKDDVRDGRKERGERLPHETTPEEAERRRRKARELLARIPRLKAAAEAEEAAKKLPEKKEQTGAAAAQGEARAGAAAAAQGEARAEGEGKEKTAGAGRGER
eukprot:gene35605-64921_t